MVPDTAPQAVAAQHVGDKPLTIKRIEAIPIAIPLKKPVIMAGVRLVVSYNLLVRVEAANGLVGWGEASVAPTMTGDVLPGMVAAVEEHLAPLVTGKDALKRAEIAHLCAHAMYHNGGPKCAVDAAIADLAGRHLNVSLSDMYGGALRDEITAMYLLGNPKIEDDIAETHKKIAEGYKFFKLKVGIKNPFDEADAAVAIRKAVGRDVVLCADANMGMDFRSARIFVERSRDADLLFLEQPLRDDDYDGMAELARISPVPLNGDESLGNVATIIQMARAGSIKGANLKTIKLGGVSATVHAMSVCAALGLNINLACKVAETSVGAATIIHIGCVAPNVNWGVSITNHYLTDDIVKNPIVIRNGMMARPTGAGNGVEVDESQVARYTIKV
jgi:L-alanine-DL-glutamate epimerase-like enolase superfamily enzyme